MLCETVNFNQDLDWSTLKVSYENRGKIYFVIKNQSEFEKAVDIISSEIQPAYIYLLERNDKVYLKRIIYNICVSKNQFYKNTGVIKNRSDGNIYTRILKYIDFEKLDNYWS